MYAFRAIAQRSSFVPQAVRRLQFPVAQQQQPQPYYPNPQPQLVWPQQGRWSGHNVPHQQQIGHVLHVDAPKYQVPHMVGEAFPHSPGAIVHATHAIPGSLSEFARLLKSWVDTNQEHDIIRAMHTLLEATSIDQNCCVVVINGLVAINQPDNGLYVLRELQRRNVRMTAVCYNILLKAFLRADRMDVVESLWQEMISSQIHPDVVSYGTLVDGFGKRGDIAKVDALLYDMSSRSVPQSVIFLNTLIKVFCMAGLTDRVESTFIQLKHRYTPDRTTFNIMLDFYSKNHNEQRLSELLNEMSTANVQPDKFSLSSLLKHYCETGQMQRAEELFNGRIRPLSFCDRIAFNTLLNGYCAHKMVQQATQLLAPQMEQELGFAPDRISYNSLIRMYCQMGTLHKAWSAYMEMVGRGLRPDLVTFNTLLDGYSSMGDAQFTYKVISEMDRWGITQCLRTYNTLIHAWCVAKDMSKAEEVLGQLRAKGLSPDRITFNTLINGYASAGMLDAANQCVQEMEQAGHSSDIITFNTLLKGHTENHDIERAEKMLQNALLTRPECVDGSSYAVVMLAYVRAGDTAGMMAKLGEMERFKISPNSACYNIAINSLCAEGRIDDALTMFREISASGNPAVDAITYSTFIDYYGRAKQFDVAHAVLDSMRRAGVTPTSETLKLMIGAVGRARRIELYSEMHALGFTVVWPTRDMPFWVDLHSLTRAETETYMVLHFDMLHEMHKANVTLVPLQLITGRGLHSEGNLAVVKDLIHTLMCAWSGHSIVNTHENPGCYLVPVESVRAICKNWPQIRESFLLESPSVVADEVN